MKLNLITLMSDLHAKNKQVLKDNREFIDELNNLLLDEDILLEENSTEGSIDAVFVASGGAEQKFSKIIDNLSEPFILFSNSKNNSLAASFEIKTYSSYKNHSTCFICGNVEEVAAAMKHISNIIYTYQKIKDTNLGVIGKPSDWLIASTVDKKEVYENYKINLVNIPMKELTDLIELHDIDNTISRYEELVKKYKDHIDTLNMALCIYTAIKKLVKKYELKGLTIRCFDLLKKYKNTACLALALLNEEGIVSACEGDVPSLITMYLINTLTNRPCFMANPSQIDLQKMELVLAHCSVPFNMVNKYELMTHFESDQGIGIKGQMMEGNISICKISPDLKGKNDLIITGNIKENLSLPGFCRTQIRVQLDEGDMFGLFKENFGNHVIVTYSDITPDFYPLLNLIKNKEIY
ncbi:MAG: hypothetical protein MJ217_02005 [Bacilli bacterium]|nr:hypothetical protein [Bacilli bacterium]